MIGIIIIGICAVVGLFTILHKTLDKAKVTKKKKDEFEID